MAETRAIRNMHQEGDFLFRHYYVVLSPKLTLHIQII